MTARHKKKLNTRSGGALPSRSLFYDYDVKAIRSHRGTGAREEAAMDAKEFQVAQERARNVICAAGIKLTDDEAAHIEVADC